MADKKISPKAASGSTQDVEHRHGDPRGEEEPEAGQEVREEKSALSDHPDVRGPGPSRPGSRSVCGSLPWGDLTRLARHGGGQRRPSSRRDGPHAPVRGGPADMIGALADGGNARSYRRGTYLFHQGDRPRRTSLPRRAAGRDQFGLRERASPAPHDPGRPRSSSASSACWAICRDPRRPGPRGSSDCGERPRARSWTSSTRSRRPPVPSSGRWPGRCNRTRPSSKTCSTSI